MKKLLFVLLIFSFLTPSVSAQDSIVTAVNQVLVPNTAMKSHLLKRLFFMLNNRSKTVETTLQGNINLKAEVNHAHAATQINGLHAVATTGSYNDLASKLTAGNFIGINNNVVSLASPTLNPASISYQRSMFGVNSEVGLNLNGRFPYAFARYFSTASDSPNKVYSEVSQNGFKAQYYQVQQGSGIEFGNVFSVDGNGFKFQTNTGNNFFPSAEISFEVRKFRLKGESGAAFHTLNSTTTNTSYAYLSVNKATGEISVLSEVITPIFTTHAAADAALKSGDSYRLQAGSADLNGQNERTKFEKP